MHFRPRPPRLAPALIAAFTALAGCYDAHGIGPDGSVGLDAASAMCPPIADYARCGEGCGEWRCSGEGEVCSYQLEICAIRQTDPSGAFDPRGDTCGLTTDVTRHGNAYYCFDDRICVARTSDLDLDEGFGGQCLREEYCDEAAGVVEGYVCLWSDLSERVTGAPVETACPPSAPRGGLCGGPCEDCTLDSPPAWGMGSPGGLFGMFQTACVGRSDRRGLGVCAQHTLQRCIPGTDATADSVCRTDGDFPLFPGASCACLVLENPREPGTFHPWGWATLDSTCADYRALYPGQVRCLDAAWNDLE